MLALNLIVLGILILASFLDWKYKKVPSVLLTGILFLALIINYDNLYFGIASLVFAFMIGELMPEGEWGMADIKVITLIGLLIVPNILYFIMYLLLFISFQGLYTVTWRYVLKKDEIMPFLPCLTAIYIALFSIGGLV